MHRLDRSSDLSYSWKIRRTVREAVDERVDARSRVVCAAKLARVVARHAEPAHQRLRAVVAGADADLVAAEDLGDVVRVDAVERERTSRRAPPPVGP